MRHLLLSAGFLALLASTAAADDALAARFGFPRLFDPVAGVPADQQLDNDKREPIKVVPAKHGKLVPAGNQLVGVSVSEKKLRRAMLARAKRAAILNDAAAVSAYGDAAQSTSMAWGLRFTPHY